MSIISGIEVRTNFSMESQIAFDPNNNHYEMVVPTDCFGIILRISYDPSYYIRVTSDHDAGRFDFPEIDPAMGDYRAGDNVPYYDYYGGYVLRLDKRRESFDHEIHQHIYIEASKDFQTAVTYTIDVTRGTDRAVRDHFHEEWFHDNLNGVDLHYELYVPSDYSPERSYPLLVAFHGLGERTQSIDALLKKLRMATAFAEDSENGHNQCIIAVPHCTISDPEDCWTSLVQFVDKKSDSPFWPLPKLNSAYGMILDLEQRFHIDRSRLYLTGMSAGAFATFTMAQTHPHEFAGLVAITGAADPSKLEALQGTGVWIFHAEDDPMIPVSWTFDPTVENLRKAGIDFRSTRYPAGMVLWQSAHFSWEPTYHNPEMRDWLFAQHLH